MRDGDTLATGLFLILAVAPFWLMLRDDPTSAGFKASLLILACMSIPFAVRLLVGLGLLFRGMFDAHVDPHAIEFGGPWRTDTFERSQTIAILAGGGPLVDLILLHRSGRRARLLLSNHGAWKLLTIWGALPPGGGGTPAPSPNR